MDVERLPRAELVDTGMLSDVLISLVSHTLVCPPSVRKVLSTCFQLMINPHFSSMKPWEVWHVKALKCVSPSVKSACGFWTAVIRAMFTPTLSTEGQDSPYRGHTAPKNKNLESFLPFSSHINVMNIHLGRPSFRKSHKAMDIFLIPPPFLIPVTRV